MLNASKRRLSTACACCSGPFAATTVSRRQMLAGGTAALAVGAPNIRSVGRAAKFCCRLVFEFCNTLRCKADSRPMTSFGRS